MAEPVPLGKNRQFQLLWIGSAASSLGSELTRVAVPLLLIASTGNAALAGMVTSLLVASMIIVQIPAGVWVDQWDRRKILQICQFLQLVNSAVLTAVLLISGVHVASFVVFAVIDGACQAFLHPARDVAIRGVVPGVQLRTAYSREEARQHGARLLGPALGGALYTLNVFLPFIFDTVSFFVAWLCTVGARVPRRPITPTNTEAEVREDEPRGMVSSAHAAFIWLVRKKGLREVILVIMGMNLLGGMSYIPMIAHLGSLGSDASTTGFVLSAIGVGGLIGALASGRLTSRIPPGMLAISVPAVFGVCLLLASLPLPPMVVAVPLVVFSVTTPALNIASQAVTAEMVPHDMLGRVGGLITVVARGLAPIGPLVGGILTDQIGGGPTLAIAGAGLVLLAFVALSSRALREFRGGEEQEPPL
ncbi:MAG: MFS transporter [Ancrocorticia sp.]